MSVITLHSTQYQGQPPTFYFCSHFLFQLLFQNLLRRSKPINFFTIPTSFTSIVYHTSTQLNFAGKPMKDLKNSYYLTILIPWKEVSSTVGMIMLKASPLSVYCCVPLQNTSVTPKLSVKVIITSIHVNTMGRDSRREMSKLMRLLTATSIYCCFSINLSCMQAY